MNLKTYFVWFRDGSYIQISAMGFMEAKILAQAERINNAMSYDVSTIEEIKGDD